MKKFVLFFILIPAVFYAKSNFTLDSFCETLYTTDTIIRDEFLLNSAGSEISGILKSVSVKKSEEPGYSNVIQARYAYRNGIILEIKVFITNTD